MNALLILLLALILPRSLPPLLPHPPTIPPALQLHPSPGVTRQHRALQRQHDDQQPARRIALLAKLEESVAAYAAGEVGADEAVQAAVPCGQLLSAHQVQVQHLNDAIAVSFRT